MVRVKLADQAESFVQTTVRRTIETVKLRLCNVLSTLDFFLTKQSRRGSAGQGTKSPSHVMSLY